METLIIMMDALQHAIFSLSMFALEFHQTAEMFAEMDYLMIDQEKFVIMDLSKQAKLKMVAKMIALEKMLDGLATTPLVENQFAGQYVEMV